MKRVRETGSMRKKKTYMKIKEGGQKDEKKETEILRQRRKKIRKRKGNMKKVR